MDFKNQKAVRILTTCLLKKDFDLDVKIPDDRLVPTLTLRLNYILWVEDLLNFAGRKENIIGVDVGAGASAIYCLLGAKYKNWKMLGLEIDEVNVNQAIENVARNNLDELVTIVPQDVNSKKLFSKVDFTANEVDFCMMNPPFFSSTNDIVNSKNRTGKRKHSSSQIRGADTEVIFKGGETEIVGQMVEESVELGGKFKIYSTMLGCKSSLSIVKKLLKTSNITNFTTIEFVQGKTTRWGIAWTFSEEFDLGSFCTLTSTQLNLNKKNSHVLSHTFSHPEEHEISFQTAKNNLLNILKKIDFKIRTISENSKNAIWEISAIEKTWLNLRRKRREQKRQEALGISASENHDAASHSNKTPSLLLGLELKLSEVETDKKGFDLKIFFISGNFGKICAGEVLQYIKNNFVMKVENRN